MVRELERAEIHFGGGGFVGALFHPSMERHEIPDAPELRRLALQRLIDEGLVKPTP